MLVVSDIVLGMLQSACDELQIYNLWGSRRTEKAENTWK